MKCRIFGNNHRDTFLFCLNTSEPAQSFQNCCICLGFDQCCSWRGNSRCPVLMRFLEPARGRARPVPASVRLCLLRQWGTLRVAAVGTPTCKRCRRCQAAIDSRRAHTWASQKGCLVDSMGNNVDTFCCRVLCRTRETWSLFHYGSVGVQLFYLVTRDDETQKTQCNWTIGV